MSRRVKLAWDPREATPGEVQQIALGLLARREHSVLELRHKLQHRGLPAEVVEQVLEHLCAENWLSDARFAELYAATRADKGYGPLRIRSELRQRGVEDVLIERALGELEEYWSRRLAEVTIKKFGSRTPKDFDQRARWTRFLRQRGFSLEQIGRLFRDDEV